MVISVPPQDKFLFPTKVSNFGSSHLGIGVVPKFGKRSILNLMSLS